MEFYYAMLSNVIVKNQLTNPITQSFKGIELASFEKLEDNIWHAPRILTIYLTPENYYVIKREIPSGYSTWTYDPEIEFETIFQRLARRLFQHADPKMRAYAEAVG